MNKLKRYRRKPDNFITAVRLDLDTEGFDYRKWGNIQHCKAGDWLVNNGGETYTIDAEVFESTYRRISPGVYAKITRVYACQASEHGRVKTKEGESAYAPGDYLVANNADGTDAYCMTAEKFRQMYEPIE
jgi:hypothetical protein